MAPYVAYTTHSVLRDDQDMNLVAGAVLSTHSAGVGLPYRNLFAALGSLADGEILTIPVHSQDRVRIRASGRARIHLHVAGLSNTFERQTADIPVRSRSELAARLS